MFNKILIANRGEVALRIIRACKELNIKTVAVFSQADRDSLHVKYADEALCIGPPPSQDSYLNIPNVITAAQITDADAIHPGYGFLSESTDFAQICHECGITFIGPSPKTVELMGNKSKARQVMKDAGVSVIPGSDGIIEDLDHAKAIARKFGYPVVIKASAGGGGKGLRIAHTEGTLASALTAAQTEAEAAFESSDVYMERYLEGAKHIEFQLLADSFGHVVYLGERDCSIQRKYQKLIEESPAMAVNPALRKKIGEAAVRGAKAAGYTNVGTMEFMLEGRGHFYFIEMNARIQVEHPVTEMVTGIDLIKEQIRLAAKEKLGYRQDDIHLAGHAIECRINAEDPQENFRPASGRITDYSIPGGPGIRVDSHLHEGYTVLPFYDSLVAKLICWGRDRNEAIARILRALDEYIIEGVKTTIPFHRKVLASALFKEGKIYTNFIEHFAKE